jgi:hypothetical protein
MDSTELRRVMPELSRFAEYLSAYILIYAMYVVAEMQHAVYLYRGKLEAPENLGLYPFYFYFQYQFHINFKLFYLPAYTQSNSSKHQA